MRTRHALSTSAPNVARAGKAKKENIVKFALSMLALMALVALVIQYGPIEFGDAMGIAGLIESLM